MAAARLLRRGSASIAVSFSDTGDNAVIAAVANQTIRVVRLVFTVSAATSITFKDGTGTNLTGAMAFGANGGMVLELDDGRDPWFTTTAGNAFVMNQSGTATVGGRIYYEQSTAR